MTIRDFGHFLKERGKAPILTPMKAYLSKLLQAAMMVILLFGIAAAQQEQRVRFSYFPSDDSTMASVEPVAIPGNRRRFSVGAYFTVKGQNLDRRPCCVTLIFTSIGKKKFEFKNDHRVSIDADDETLEFPDADWRESNYATAFVIARIAYPEEIYAGMETEKFLKIVNATKVKVRVGSFKFTLTAEQKRGLAELAKHITEDVRISPEKMKEQIIKADFPDVPDHIRTYHATEGPNVFVRVDGNGSVTEVKAFITYSKHLKSYLEQAAMNWKFKPLVVDGRNVPFRGIIPARFRYGSLALNFPDPR